MTFKWLSSPNPDVRPCICLINFLFFHTVALRLQRIVADNSKKMSFIIKFNLQVISRFAERISYICKYKNFINSGVALNYKSCICALKTLNEKKIHCQYLNKMKKCVKNIYRIEGTS